MRRSGIIGCLALSVSFIALSVGEARPEEARNAPSLGIYGNPGLIDMPTGEMLPDASLAFTYGQLEGVTRTSIYFQILPRLSGSFRYSALDNMIDNGTNTLFDRSFDLRYQLLTETRRRPSVVVGFNDVIGTGIYSGEYIAATKTVAPGLKITGGIGWGRLGSNNAFGSTGTRPSTILGEGGIPTYDRWFRGDVAAFGGLSYKPTDKLTLKLEYSSDAYTREDNAGTVDYENPVNIGLDYAFARGNGQASLYYMMGTEVGAQVSFVTNPKTSGVPGGTEPSGLPVQPRPMGAAADLGWTANIEQVRTNSQTSLGALIEAEGMRLEAMTLDGRSATVRVVNPKYGAEPQAIGRVARAMTRSLPASVERFEIIPVVNGMPMASYVVNRTDLERLEHDAASEMLARTTIRDAAGRTPRPDRGVYPRFSYNISPYVQFSVFDPNNPVRADFGVRATGKVDITPNFVFSGSVAQKLTGNLDETRREDESNLPRVRTDQARYSSEAETAIENLQLAYYARPGKNLYGRVTAGYLEQMYGGVSAELLWKPVGSRFALGAEVNYIERRDFDQGFGFQSMTTVDPVTGEKRTIPNVNGHISAYYDLGRGFHGQVDVGQYLAGDVGGTVALDREFANGWRVGAYATFTDASFEDFGEGSFDKGIRFTIPIASLTGRPSRKDNTFDIKSLSRDGGARLNVEGRLYEQVRNYHEPEAVKSWGRFWR